MQIINETKAIPHQAKPPSVFRTRTQSFCLKCKAQVGLVDAAHAAEFMKTARFEIYRLAETGRIHRVHNSKGDVMFCFKSILEFETGADEADFSNAVTLFQINLLEM